MTLIMLWREASAERIWLVSDSRLSVQGAVGHTRYTDRAAKILEALITLYGSPPSTLPLASRRIGFAYAGSSLVALQAYSAILPLWTRLSRSDGQTELPTIGECADHLSKFVNGYALEVGASGGGCACQCFLVGFDEYASSLEAWMIEADPTAIVSKRQLALPSGEMSLFGSGADEADRILSSWNRAREGWGQEPIEMMRQYLKVDASNDVGGGVQIGMTTKDGFELCFDAQPFTLGSSRLGDALLTMRYRGFDFSEISSIGSTFTTLRAIGRAAR